MLGVEQLLYTMSDADAPLDRHLDQLVDIAVDRLHQVFEHCEGYRGPEERSREQRRAYRRAHMIPAQAV